MLSIKWREVKAKAGKPHKLKPEKESSIYSIL